MFKFKGAIATIDDSGLQREVNQIDDITVFIYRDNGEEAGRIVLGLDGGAKIVCSARQRAIAELKQQGKIDVGQEHWPARLQELDKRFCEIAKRLMDKEDQLRAQEMQSQRFIENLKRKNPAEYERVKNHQREIGILPPTPKPETAPQNAKSKRGPRTYSKQEKITAYLEWQELDRDNNPIKLEEWLENYFGCEADGVLNVPNSTFYGWKKLVETS